MPNPFQTSGFTAVSLAVLTACGGQVDVRPGPTLAPECAVLDLEAQPPETVSVALFHEVDPAHAPRAQNASERLLFRNVYETLIHSDCLGDVYGGLAESWSRSEGGRSWSFVLREDIYFWDGGRITADDVAASWRESVIGGLARAAGLDSMIVDDERTITLFFDRALAEAPRFLGGSDFAVIKRSASSPWPIGSGPYRIEAGTPADEINAIPTVNSTGFMIRFRLVGGADTRDLLEERIDVMVTTDPAAIEYAEKRSELEVAPLPWDQTYLLLSTTRMHALRRGEPVSPLPEDLLEAIARDAVRESARGHRPPGWWADLHHCHDLASALPGLPPVPRGAFAGSGWRRIIYREDDRVARGLADRIVALGQSLAAAIPQLEEETRGIVARGLPRDEFDRGLRDGADFAYIVPVPLRPVDACFEARRLAERVQWVAQDGVELGTALVPLVDTRRHIIARPRSANVTLDAEGMIVFHRTVGER